MEPAAFAAELISRLEKLQLELESRHTLEERLQQIREVVLAPPYPALPPSLCQWSLLLMGSPPLLSSLPG